MVLAENVARPPVDLEPLRISDEEFERLQDTDGSVRGYELEDGRLVPMSPVSGAQSSAWGDFYFYVRQYVDAGKTGKVWLDLATYLDPGGRRRYFPDLVYLASEDLDRYDGNKVVGAPTMVCEVVGESSRERDYEEKMPAYFDAGVEWYWIVDLVERYTREYRRGDAGYELVSSVPFGQPFRPLLFPGLEIVLPE